MKQNLFGKDNTNLACLITLLIFFLLLYVNSYKSRDRLGATSCDFLLDVDSYSNSGDLHPDTCRLKDYQVQDTVQCLEKLGSKVNQQKRKDHFHIAFVGDSRIRQMYHAFVSMIPMYDMEVEGHSSHLKFVHNTSGLVVSRLLGLKATFLWRPFSHVNTTESLEYWISNGPLVAPDVLIIGQLLWFLNRGSYKYDKTLYQRNMEHLSDLLAKLAPTTKVIWWDQDHMHQMLYERTYAVWGDINQIIDKYNKVARQELKRSGSLIWSSTHPLYRKSIRACTLFGRKDPTGFWDCRDPIHAGFALVKEYIQQLLNYLCNPLLNEKQSCCWSS